ncbi:threonine/serine dehydratase [Fodinicurvata sp. EGI_FJ10296]|uniref:threonine ammonia-lyase n=1 Tax=Fodinicurvata sp. EGI_FJ10296 TaxID=3231908 RepID=UPI0034555B5E
MTSAQMKPGEPDIRAAGDEPVPTAAMVHDAAERIAGLVRETPLLNAPSLDRIAGRRILVKAESLQITGSFKLRGASNRIAVIPEDHRGGGVVAYSSGNHAQGVAAAASRLGLPAIIVMPADAPAVKLDATRAWGAEVRPYDRQNESREEIGQQLARERGATLVKPYDDPYIVAGQGTVGLEIARQAAAMGIRPDAVVCSCSGGGLVSGTALAVRDTWPDMAVYASEPAGFDDIARSLAAGERVANDGTGDSFCDALLAPMPGEVTLPVMRHTLAGGLVVTDDDVAEAMRLAFAHLKLVIEPGGAVALAAALSGKLPKEVETVVCVASGGNVDGALFSRILTG